MPVWVQNLVLMHVRVFMKPSVGILIWKRSSDPYLLNDGLYDDQSVSHKLEETDHTVLTVIDILMQQHIMQI